MRKRTSIIWQTSTEKLAELTKIANSLGDILKYFGLDNKGHNSRTLKKRLIEENVDFSHITLGLNSNKGRKFIKDKRSLSELLIKNSTASRGNLKKRLINEGILKEICTECEQEPIWRSKKLVLVLDHINGTSNDNRLENLRLLCPNCNSQTDTFCGKTQKRKQFTCSNCEHLRCKQSKSGLCLQCSSLMSRKTKRPDKEDLLSEVNILGYTKVSKKYGVSDNAIRKWLK